MLWAMTSALLRVVCGPASGFIFEVSTTVELGRGLAGSPELADPAISRRHARLAFDAAGHLTIEDLGSSNGTLVNGSPISGVTLLYTGDVIDLGDSTIHVAEAPVVVVTSRTAISPVRTTVSPALIAGAAPVARESVSVSRSSSMAAGLPVLSPKSLMAPVRVRTWIGAIAVVVVLWLILVLQLEIGDDPGLAT